MELGQYQMQMFVSLVVILGAAFVALICDLLKGNNEQLRELALELKVRREEEHKRFQILAPRVLAEATAGAPLSALPEASQAAPVKIAEGKAPENKLAETAERKPKRPRDPNRKPLSGDALAAIQLGEQLAASPKGRRATLPSLAERRVERPAQPAMRPEAVPPTVMEPTVEILAPAASLDSTPVAASPASRSRDWGQLLSVRRSVLPRAAGKKTTEGAGLLDAVMEATASGASVPAEPALPAGFQDGFVLTKLVESRQPVSGLVVSIGATSLQNTDLSNVRGLIQSLLGPADFAAQSGNDEFLLIYPGERGASAQRKLSQIAEQLWDFQLRSMGALSIQFSWGGVEVRSESISEAIASATERMEETRRGRKLFTMEARPEAEAPLRRAV